MRSPPREVTTCRCVLRLIVIGALLSSCVTARLTVADTQTCDAFGPVDNAVRAELDTLLASAPGEELVRESSRGRGRTTRRNREEAGRPEGSAERNGLVGRLGVRAAEQLTGPHSRASDVRVPR